MSGMRCSQVCYTACPVNLTWLAKEVNDWQYRWHCIQSMLRFCVHSDKLAVMPCWVWTQPCNYTPHRVVHSKPFRDGTVTLLVCGASPVWNSAAVKRKCQTGPKCKTISNEEKGPPSRAQALWLFKRQIMATSCQGKRKERSWWGSRESQAVPQFWPWQWEMALTFSRARVRVCTRTEP